MSLQLELLQSQTKRESIIMIALTISFAIIGIGLLLVLIDIFLGQQYDTSEIYTFAIKNVLDNQPSRWDILFWSIPLILTGLSVAVAFKAGLFNIGGQGQMMIGGGFAAIWAAEIIPRSESLNHLTEPWFMIPSTLLAGMIGGGLWGFVPGFLKAKTGAHEVITTILMNLIALSVINFWFVSQSYSPFVDDSPSAVQIGAYGQSNIIHKSAQFSPIDSSISSNFNWGILVVIAAIIITHLLVFRSNFGFKLRAVGLNPVAAKTAGINSFRVTIAAMTISGMLSGLAGALMVMGRPPYKYIIGIQGTFGFDGIAVALIGANTPIGVGIAGIFFGFLRQSRLGLEIHTDIPSDLVFVFQGFIILFTAAPLIAKRLMKFTKKLYYSIILLIRRLKRWIIQLIKEAESEAEL